MLIYGIYLDSLLSFGPEPKFLEMKPLNVMIGSNGSGKSNLIEAISLLQAAPEDLAAAVRKGGYVGDWIWKGDQQITRAISTVALEGLNDREHFLYTLAFKEIWNRFEVSDELIAKIQFSEEGKSRHLYFHKLGEFSEDKSGTYEFNRSQELKLKREDLDPEQSILSQRKGRHYHIFTYIGNQFKQIKIYRDWFFGRNTPPRIPQPADLPNNFLSEDCRNLGLVLNQLRRNPKAKAKFLEALRKLYEDISDFEVIVEGGNVQVFMQEGQIPPIPATRLSDGTLRYLCLLAILCHPNPPPLICIEEPELGLHPDILPTIADLLVEASERCQLIVTTHSEVLVDALTHTPESIVVCEKHQGQTTMRRLDKDKLAKWLEEYRLGELWSSGELGGNRW